ncbi:MAG TPA: GAF and ANTAR domain-containing protein [Actinomycetota bacterium]|nr:GAF and ANTAR domain-containing protein [Actinomycetota bacterium]
MSQLFVSQELVDALHSLSSILDQENVLAGTLNNVVNLSVATLPGCDSAGVTLRIGNRDTTAAASDEYTLEIDKIQYGEAQGPCVAAIDDSEPKQIHAVAEETRWPDFCKRAAAKGFRSSLSFPLNGDGSSGALNLYSTRDHGFDDESSFAVAEIFARQAAIALRNASTYAAARRVADQLHDALLSRDLIGQAKGILMEREGVTDDQAFGMLKTISQNSNIKLRDVAQRLVEERVAASAT